MVARCAQFIIEMKVWQGDDYHELEEEQLFTILSTIIKRGVAWKRPGLLAGYCLKADV